MVEEKIENSKIETLFKFEDEPNLRIFSLAPPSFPGTILKNKE